MKKNKQFYLSSELKKTHFENNILSNILLSNYLLMRQNISVFFYLLTIFAKIYGCQNCLRYVICIEYERQLGLSKEQQAARRFSPIARARLRWNGFRLRGGATFHWTTCRAEGAAICNIGRPSRSSSL